MLCDVHTTLAHIRAEVEFNLREMPWHFRKVSDQIIIHPTEATDFVTSWFRIVAADTGNSSALNTFLAIEPRFEIG